MYNRSFKFYRSRNNGCRHGALALLYNWRWGVVLLTLFQCTFIDHRKATYTLYLSYTCQHMVSWLPCLSKAHVFRIQVSISLSMVSAANDFSWGCKLSDVEFIFSYLWHSWCLRFDDLSFNKIYAIKLGCIFHPRKSNVTKIHLESSSSAVKQLPGVTANEWVSQLICSK